MTRWPAIWRARWIWFERPRAAEGLIRLGGIPPREMWNRFGFARRSFSLDVVPSSVPARVTADSRFVLFVNGIEVARGPARSMPERLAYCELDLAPYLRTGENVVAAVVRYYGRPIAWWRPAPPNGQLGYGSFIFEAPSIDLATDAGWRWWPAPYTQDVPESGELPNPATEIVDGAGMADGWTTPSFDDSRWTPAVELRAGVMTADRLRVPAEPYAAMEPDEIAPLTALPVTLTSLGTRAVPLVESGDPVTADTEAQASRGAGAGQTAVLFDAGGITLATPWVEVEGAAGAVVDLYAGEDLREDGTVEIQPRAYALRYRLGHGEIERIEGFEAVGFRYLSAVVRGEGRVRAAGATERRYPRGPEAAFSCSDERLNRIWAMGARTLDVCATDAFLDCPGREQRAWLGDAYIHALLSYVTNNDWRLVRRHLRLCAQSRRSDGLLTMSAAGDLSMVATTIPDYSLHWLRTLARFYEYSGDLETVRELLPTARAIVAAFERYRTEDGLLRGVPGWVFIDWASTQRSEVVGALDALYAAALDDLVMLLAATGDADEAARVAGLRDRTRSAFELLWDPERGVYVDAADADGPLGRVSQHTNAMAILGGCAPPQRWPAMLDAILDERRLVVTPTQGDLGVRTGIMAQWSDPATLCDFDERTNVVAAQPFFSHFVHQAVVMAGHRGLIPSLCLRWWAQIERGNTTFEEYWRANPGAASRAHAWSATPAYDLTTHILGVYPLAPGYTRAALRPMFGPLERVSGRVPTPHGLIEVDLTREGGTVIVPDGVVVEAAFEEM
ncbi:MAG: alpha-L-rhamnosidase C-terminal domain-containing protein, partial [Dehalococcoidia bacterium]